jgi:hypothetical protein
MHIASIGIDHFRVLSNLAKFLIELCTPLCAWAEAAKQFGQKLPSGFELA